MNNWGRELRANTPHAKCSSSGLKLRTRLSKLHLCSFSSRNLNCSLVSRSRRWPPAALCPSTWTELLAGLAGNSGSVVGPGGHGAIHGQAAARGPRGTFPELQAEGGLEEGGARLGDEGSVVEDTREPGNVLGVLLGEGEALPVHFCQHCGFPIRIYGRLAPCQHVFCCDCALLVGHEGGRTCPRCEQPVQEVNLYSPQALQV